MNAVTRCLRCKATINKTDYACWKCGTVISESQKLNPQSGTASINKDAEEYSTPPLSIFFFILSILSMVGGVILAIVYSRGDNMSIVWIAGGFLEGAIFAAIGQGLSYLNQIAINTAPKA